MSLLKKILVKIIKHTTNLDERYSGNRELEDYNLRQRVEVQDRLQELFQNDCIVNLRSRRREREFAG